MLYYSRFEEILQIEGGQSFLNIAEVTSFLNGLVTSMRKSFNPWYKKGNFTRKSVLIMPY